MKVGYMVQNVMTRYVAACLAMSWSKSHQSYFVENDGSLRIPWDEADNSDDSCESQCSHGNSTISVSKPSAFACTMHFLYEFFKIFSHPSSTAKINLTAYLLIGYTPQQEM
jgi:hypothetical protein